MRAPCNPDVLPDSSARAATTVIPLATCATDASDYAAPIRQEQLITPCAGIINPQRRRRSRSLRTYRQCAGGSGVCSMDVSAYLRGSICLHPRQLHRHRRRSPSAAPAAHSHLHPAAASAASATALGMATSVLMRQRRAVTLSAHDAAPAIPSTSR
jgi:hypothetical protein